MKVLNFQQGGMITAPNPQPYRMPLQGLDPNAFDFKLETAPIDTSGMIQVLQFQENADLRRQQLAMELEKEKVKKEIEEAKLAHQEKKFAFDFISKINKSSKSSGGTVIDMKGNPIHALENTLWFKSKFTDPNVEIERLREENSKLSLDITPTNALRISENTRKITELYNKKGSDMEFQIESTKRNKVMSILSGDSKVVPKGFAVNHTLTQQFLDQQNEALDNPFISANSQYEIGSPDIPAHLIFNPEEQEKELQSMFTTLLSSYTVDGEPEFQAVGERSNIMRQGKTEHIVLDLPEVIKRATTAIVNNKTIASHLSNKHGINFFNESGGVDEVKVKGVLESSYGPIFEALVRSKELGTSIKVTKLDPNSLRNKSTFNANYNSNRTGGYNNESNVNYNKPFSPEPKEVGKEGEKPTPNEVMNEKAQSKVDNFTPVEGDTYKKRIEEFNEAGLDLIKHKDIFAQMVSDGTFQDASRKTSDVAREFKRRLEEKEKKAKEAARKIGDKKIQEQSEKNEKDLEDFVKIKESPPPKGTSKSTTSKTIPPKSTPIEPWINAAPKNKNKNK